MPPPTWNPGSAPGYCVWFFQLLYKVFLKSKNEGNEGESNASAGGNHDNSEANNNTSEVLKPSQKQNTTADSNHGNKDITQTYTDTVNKYYLEYIEQSVSIFYVLLCDLYPWCANQGLKNFRVCSLILALPVSYVSVRVCSLILVLPVLYVSGRVCSLILVLPVSYVSVRVCSLILVLPVSYVSVRVCSLILVLPVSYVSVRVCSLILVLPVSYVSDKIDHTRLY